MNISLDLLSILQTYKKVYLPGIGGFILRYRSARIDTTKGQINPPGGEIIFDPKMAHGDDILKKFYTTNYPDRPENEIESEISSSLGRLINQLDSESEIEFSGIGILKKHDKGQYTFKPTPVEDVLPETYGLKPIELDDDKFIEDFQLPKESVSSKAHTVSGTKSRNYGWLVILVLIVVLGGLSVVFFTSEVKNFIQKISKISTNVVPSEEESLPENDYNYKVGSFKTDSSDKKTSLKDNENNIINENEILEKRLDAETQFKNALYYEETLLQKTDFSKFYIIAGSFTNYENAVKLQSQLRTNDYDPEILETDDGRYRVTLNSYNKKSSALEQLKNYKIREQDLDLWLLSL